MKHSILFLLAIAFCCYISSCKKKDQDGTPAVESTDYYTHKLTGERHCIGVSESQWPGIPYHRDSINTILNISYIDPASVKIYGNIVELTDTGYPLHYRRYHSSSTNYADLYYYYISDSIYYVSNSILGAGMNGTFT